MRLLKNYFSATRKTLITSLYAIEKWMNLLLMRYNKTKDLNSHKTFCPFMEPVRILPHHAIHFFEVFYLGLPAENGISWYDNEKMKENGVMVINTVVQNPETLVQIVDTYDETCRMCPRNRHGDNYAQNPEDTCTTYDNGDVSDRNFAEILGLEGVLDGEPITARQFFELMRPTFEKLQSEPEYDKNNKRMSLHQIFRVPRNKILPIDISYKPFADRCKSR